MDKVMSLKDMQNLVKPAIIVQPPKELDEINKAVLQAQLETQNAPRLRSRPVQSKAQQYGNRTSNRERSGTRDLTLSTQLRKVGTGADSLSDDIRHKDNDFSQHCAKCSRAYLFIEGSTDPSKATTYIRAMAEDVKHKAWAIKIIHYSNDLDGTKGVKEIKIWENGRTLVENAKDLTWEQVIKACERIHMAHVHSFGCKRRAKFD